MYDIHLDRGEIPTGSNNSPTWESNRPYRPVFWEGFDGGSRSNQSTLCNRGLSKPALLRC